MHSNRMSFESGVARGIAVQMTAGEAHWQIGIVETPDATINELVEHSVVAKVRRQTFDGYGPMQWWFGTQCAREVEEH